ncbi:serine hydrolase domain-containing protein [Chitinolyticbacter meiyuanensis]|uniref:serine hydrolase domain-containing protein n=1 Tax=Chitinolyticbacter meiyuanensis TaxID=682798 RepID=UPI0011E58A47|nr:serine hydrolase domain-containing protein [Chitinolyticbacter meiyuanensis]
MLIRPFALATLALALAACGGDNDPTQPSTPTPTPAPTPVQPSYAADIAALQQAIASEMQQRQIPGLAIALVDGDRVVWQQGFGVTDLTTPAPVDADTLFRAGSISKLFTATALMQLVEAGKLSPDQSLASALPGFTIQSRWQPDVAAANAEVTLRRVLTHHAGLPEASLAGMGANPEATPTTLPSLVNGTWLAQRPGQLFAYSNLGFDLLGAVIETASGQRYSERMQQAMLQPLGMRRSSFLADATPGRAHGHIDGQSVDIQLEYDGMPAGGLWSSAADMSRFLRMVLNQGELDGQRILQPATLAGMLAPQNGDNRYDGDCRIGLGWVVSPCGLTPVAPGVPMIHHDGSTIGFNAQLMLLPEQKLGVIVLANSDSAGGYASELATDALRRLWARKTGRPLPAAPQLPASGLHTPSQDDLQHYPGLYIDALGSAGPLEITVQNGQLHLRAPGEAEAMQLFRDDDGWLRLPGEQGTADRNRRLQWREVDGNALLFLQNAAGQSMLFASKVTPSALPAAWLARLGQYRQEGSELEVMLAEQDGWLVLSGGNITRLLQPLDDQRAVFAGLGRGVGDVLEAGADQLSGLGIDFQRVP